MKYTILAMLIIAVTGLGIIYLQPEEKHTEMTVKEIEEKLGYKVKIVK